MIKLIYKRKDRDYYEVDEIPHELPYGLALSIALGYAKNLMATCDNVHIVNRWFMFPGKTEQLRSYCIQNNIPFIEIKSKRNIMTNNEKLTHFADAIEGARIRLSAAHFIFMRPQVSGAVTDSDLITMHLLLNRS